MKKRIVLLLLVIFLFSFYGCKEKPKDTPKEEIKDDIKEEILPEEEIKEEETVLKEYTKEDGMRFDLPKDVVSRYQTFVIPFNISPEEFSDAKDLSDYTILFTAANALQVEFVLSIDGMTSSLPISRLESKIKEYFGPEAKLSDGYASKDYFPYSVENDEIVQLSSGGLASFFFPYAFIDLEEGYELYLINLMDPLFFNDYDNQDRLFSGNTITYEEISDIALQLQFNIYHIVEQPNGRLMLKGFRYENKKDITNIIL